MKCLITGELLNVLHRTPKVFHYRRPAMRQRHRTHTKVGSNSALAGVLVTSFGACNIADTALSSLSRLPVSSGGRGLPMQAHA